MSRKKEHKHNWYAANANLFSEVFSVKYLQRVCCECGYSQRAKLNWLDSPKPQENK